MTWTESVYGMTVFYDWSDNRNLEKGSVMAAFASGRFYITGISGNGAAPPRPNQPPEPVAGVEAIAYAVKPNIKRILFIGVGTAGELISFKKSFPSSDLVVVEINPDLIRFMRENAHDDIKAALKASTVVEMDGRRYLNQLPDAIKFDYVHIGVHRATTTGAGNLFSAEFLTKLRDRLEPGGVVTFYGYPVVARAALSVFPDLAVATHISGTTLLAATNQPGGISNLLNSGKFGSNFSDAVNILNPRGDSAFHSAGALTGVVPSGWIMQSGEVRKYLDVALPVATDDHLVTEYYLNNRTEMIPQLRRNSGPVDFRVWPNVEKFVMPFPFVSPRDEVSFGRRVMFATWKPNESSASVTLSGGEIEALASPRFDGTIEIRHKKFINWRNFGAEGWQWNLAREKSPDFAGASDQTLRVAIVAEKTGRARWGAKVYCLLEKGPLLVQTEETSSDGLNKLAAYITIGAKQRATECGFALTLARIMHQT